MVSKVQYVCEKKRTQNETAIRPDVYDAQITPEEEAAGRPLLARWAWDVKVLHGLCTARRRCRRRSRRDVI